MALQTQRTRMLAGLVYNDLTPELQAARAHAVQRCEAYARSHGQPPAQRLALLRGLVRQAGDGAHFEPTFRCEFGFNIVLGRAFYANFDCVILDAAAVEIGDEVLLGPRVGLYTANHALDPAERAAGACQARPIRIGHRVWLGAGVHVLPGVSIGDGAVIGAGSVVTRDVAPGMLAAGVPCRVLRPISVADRSGYQPG